MTGAPPTTDRLAEGIGLILIAVAMMAFADAMVKLLSADMSVWQVFAVRAVLAAPLMALLARGAGVSLRLKAPAWVLLRSGLLVLTWLAFYAALPWLDLSVAAVAVYTNPIMIALLSAWVAGETVTRRQWLAVGLGFLGVVTILRPGAEGFSWMVLLPLLAALFYAVSMVMTRTRCREETPLALGFWLQASFLVTGAVGLLVFSVAPTDSDAAFLTTGWSPLDLEGWFLVGLLGLLSATYFTAVARAYQIAPPQIIATFDYAYLVGAAIWGFVIFAETPDIWTIAGMVLITLAGLMSARMSRADARR